MPSQRTWTDDDLRAAVAAAKTYADVRHRLGLKGGSSHVAIRVRIAELGLDDRHLREEARREHRDRQRARRARKRGLKPKRDRRTWTDDDLCRAVAVATSLNGVFRELGLVPGGDQWLKMRERIRRLKLDTRHWTKPLTPPHGGRRSWSDEDLMAALVNARSYAEVMRRLGIRGGGAHAHVKKRIEELGLDTSHLRGQGWSRGARRPSGPRRPLEEILVENSDYHDTDRLKRWLIEAGLRAARCGICGIEEWNDLPAPLHLDHINGDRRDNRLENLRLLCPNCHAQTDTYCSRNRGRYDLAPDGDA